MAQADTATAPPAWRERAGTIRRRRTLPNGRAVVGGLLVAVAAVGVFSAYTSAVAVPATSYVVAARDLAPGTTITAAGLDTVALDLPDAQRARAFDDPQQLVGATVVEPLIAGELLQEGSVVVTGVETGARAVSFSVDAARAVNGALRDGERVDVVATYGTGEHACTTVVASDVAVVSVSEGAGALVGESAGLAVTVQARSAQEAVAMTHAATAGTVTLVRATGATPQESTRVCTATEVAPR